MRAGRGQRLRATGFTYLVLLWWVAISALMLAALGQQWQLESRRQREIEFVFRAEQIQAALAAYRCATADGQPSAPRHLQQLVHDARGEAPRHHLRRLWPDPITGKDWGLLRQLPDDGIRGVYSLASGAPLRAPPGVDTYAEWRFDAQAEYTCPGQRVPPAAASAAEEAGGDL